MGAGVSSWGVSWGYSWGAEWGPVSANTCWGVSWGDSWGLSWNLTGVPMRLPGINLLGVTSGGGWMGMPRYGEEPPVIRDQLLEQPPKARRLGDSEGEPEDILPSLAARAALGGRGARARRLARSVAPVRLGGRGSRGPVPGDGPGRPGGGGGTVFEP